MTENIHNKVANNDWETAGSNTSRSISRHGRHGLTSGAKKLKRYYNRVGKRTETRIHFNDFNEN